MKESKTGNRKDWLKTQRGKANSITAE